MALEPDDPPLNFLRLEGLQAISLRPVQPAFDPLRLFPQPVGAAVPDELATIEHVDLILDPIDPLLERTNLAVVVIATIAVALTIAVG